MNSRSRSPPEPAVMEAEEELASPLISPDVVGAACTCCLIDEGHRCRYPATSATFNKRLVKTSLQRRRQLIPDPEVSHSYVCKYHRGVLYSMNSMRAKRKRKDSEEESDCQFEVDFLQLQMNTLRRYKRHYKLQLKPGTNKIQLVEAVSRHFKTIRVSEKKIVPLFISMVKSHKSKLDQPKPPDS
jgi:histone deacetylase complex subunit SAP30